jgi:gliding motility-associated-like protein
LKISKINNSVYCLLRGQHPLIELIILLISWTAKNKTMRLYLTCIILLVTNHLKSQTTFPWSGTYGGSGVSRTYTTTVSGITMSATMVNSENTWQDGSPVWFPSGSTVSGGGCSGVSATNQGMLLSTDWTSNTTKTITTTITFSSPVIGPVNFLLYDVNDDGFGSWEDKIIISGTNQATSAVNVFKVGTACVQTGGNVTGSGSPTLTFNSGQSTSCTCWGNNEINVGTSSDCIKTVTITYKSNVSPTNYNNPKQYVIVSNLKATIPTSAAPPSLITGTTNLCSGQSTILTANGGNSSTQWFEGSCTGTLVGTGNSITVAPTSTTSYYANNPGSGCISASTCVQLTVNVNPPPSAPTLSANGPTTFCPGGNVTLTSSASSGNTWSTGETTQSITVSSSGNYTVTVGSSGCSATSAPINVNVTSPTSPTITANGPTTFCPGGSVTLTSSASSGNTWTTGETTQSITVTTSGNYTVTNSTSGCSATSTPINVTITTPVTPTISANGPTTFCAGGSVTLTSSSATNNSWSTGETTQSITVISAGNYTVTAGTAGCSSTSTPINITISTPNTPTISANGPLTFCAGSSVLLNSSESSGNIWSTGETTQSITVSASGNYTVTAGTTGCSATSSQITVTVNTPITPTISANGPTTFCTGDNVTLTSSSATGNTWSTGETTQSINVTTTGTYTVTVDNNGCTVSSAATTVTVTSPANPTITSNGSTTICAGSSVTLSSNQATGNLWSTGATSQSITVNTAGTYFLTTTSSGCTSTSTPIQVTVQPTPTATFSADILSGCVPLTVNFSGPADGVNCTYTIEGGITLYGCNSSFTFAQPGCYDVTFTSVLNGCSATGIQTNMICVDAPPTAYFIENPTIFTYDSENITFNNLSQNAISYSWDFGDGTNTSTTNPTHLFSDTYNGYSVTLTATSASGCTDQYSVAIAYDDDQLIFYVPNAFTPDNDLFNQTFQPIFTSGYDPTDYSLQIFNRWGEIIFESKNTEIGWDGSYGKNHEIPIVQDDVYTWKINFKTSKNDERKDFVGHVTLIR